jgi:hypothetical protein
MMMIMVRTIPLRVAAARAYAIHIKCAPVAPARNAPRDERGRFMG